MVPHDSTSSRQGIIWAPCTRRNHVCLSMNFCTRGFTRCGASSIGQCPTPAPAQQPQTPVQCFIARCRSCPSPDRLSAHFFRLPDRIYDHFTKHSRRRSRSHRLPHGPWPHPQPARQHPPARHQTSAARGQNRAPEESSGQQRPRAGDPDSYCLS